MFTFHFGALISGLYCNSAIQLHNCSRESRLTVTNRKSPGSSFFDWLRACTSMTARHSVNETSRSRLQVMLKPGRIQKICDIDMASSCNPVNICWSISSFASGGSTGSFLSWQLRTSRMHRCAAWAWVKVSATWSCPANKREESTADVVLCCMSATARCCVFWQGNAMNSTCMVMRGEVVGILGCRQSCGMTSDFGGTHPADLSLIDTEQHDNGA